MKILITELQKNWQGNEPQRLKPAVIDLNNDRQCLFLIVSLGNGNFAEACFECDSVEAHECLHGLLTGTGGARRVDEKESGRWALYRAGYHVYAQEDDGYFFVNPEHNSRLISTRSFEPYLAEFTQLPSIYRA